jgi:hypothetical protein
MTTLTQEQINWLDKCANGRWTLNPKTGLVDVDGNFICSFQGLSDFKGVKFGKVTGDFLCGDNRLTSLEGAPQKVGVSFRCGFNCLTSLEGAPQKVGGSFYCIGNQLTSLEGAPQKVGGDFWCGKNRLTSLVGAPQRVGGELWCDANPVSAKTLVTIFDKMQEGDSFLSAAASLRNKMSKKDWKLIAPHIPEAIRPGVSMLARFGAFG